MDNILSRTEVEDLLKITDVSGELIVDGVAVKSSGFCKVKINTVDELKTILAGLNYNRELKEQLRLEREKYTKLIKDIKLVKAKVAKLETSYYEYGIMGFEGEWSNYSPTTMIKRALAEINTLDGME